MMKLPLRVKLGVSLRNVLGLFRKPTNVLLALFTAFLILSIIIWWLNIDLITYILFQAPLTFTAKLHFLWYTYEALFTSFDSLLSISILLLSLLFGINTVLLGRALKQRAANAKTAQIGGFAAILGVLSGGCAACGTALLAPALASLGATSAAAQNVGIFFNFLGSALLLYSIYRLGLLLRPAE